MSLMTDIFFKPNDHSKFLYPGLHRKSGAFLSNINLKMLCRLDNSWDTILNKI